MSYHDDYEEMQRKEEEARSQWQNETVDNRHRDRQEYGQHQGMTNIMDNNPYRIIGEGLADNHEFWTRK